MTENEIKIAVAEELGHVIRLTDEEYKLAMRAWMEEPPHAHASLTHPAKVRVTTDADYPNSLDACAEFETLMTGEEFRQYLAFLMPGRPIPKLASMDDFIEAWKQPPLARNKAFLRMRGKWKG